MLSSSYGCVGKVYVTELKNERLQGLGLSFDWWQLLQRRAIDLHGLSSAILDVRQQALDIVVQLTWSTDKHNWDRLGSRLDPFH